MTPAAASALEAWGWSSGGLAPLVCSIRHVASLAKTLCVCARTGANIIMQMRDGRLIQ